MEKLSEKVLRAISPNMESKFLKTILREERRPEYLYLISLILLILEEKELRPRVYGKFRKLFEKKAKMLMNVKTN